MRDIPELDGIPIIMLTAKAMSSDVWANWQAGVDSYITAVPAAATPKADALEGRR